MLRATQYSKNNLGQQSMKVNWVHVLNTNMKINKPHDGAFIQSDTQQAICYKSQQYS